MLSRRIVLLNQRQILSKTTVQIRIFPVPDLFSIHLEGWQARRVYILVVFSRFLSVQNRNEIPRQLKIYTNLSRAGFPIVLTSARG